MSGDTHHSVLRGSREKEDTPATNLPLSSVVEEMLLPLVTRRIRHLAKYRFSVFASRLAADFLTSSSRGRPCPLILFSQQQVSLSNLARVLLMSILIFLGANEHYSVKVVDGRPRAFNILVYKRLDCWIRFSVELGRTSKSFLTKLSSPFPEKDGAGRIHCRRQNCQSQSCDRPRDQSRTMYQC